MLDFWKHKQFSFGCGGKRQN